MKPSLVIKNRVALSRVWPSRLKKMGSAASDLLEAVTSACLGAGTAGTISVGAH